MYKPIHLQKYERPNSYIGPDYYEYFVFLVQHRDSDTLTRANWKAATIELGKIAKENEETWQIIRDSHWAVGWIEFLYIHESAEEILKAADQMQKSIEQYPVLNEEIWSEIEENEANEIWINCYDAKERLEYIRKYRSQFEFHDFADIRANVKGEYFSGYASELIG